MKRATPILAALALLLGGARPAKAGFVVNQTPSDGGNVISQVFPNQTTSTTFAFDDFATTQAYSLTSLTVLGTERGDPAGNLAVTAEIWNGLPGTGSLVQTFSGSEDGSGTLDFNLGNYALPAGSYWLTAYVVRPQSPAGMDQWFIDTHSAVSGSQAQLYNPGGGFGEGSNPFPISDITGRSADLAFALSGDVAAVPEPSAITLLGIGFVSVAGYGWRRRKHLDRHFPIDGP